MATIARQIDALGGAVSDDFTRGYMAALTDAEPIAQAADLLVDDLLTLVEEVLDGHIPLDKWATDARKIVRSERARRAS